MTLTPAIDRARRGGNPRAATFDQLRRLRQLANEAGIEAPEVSWYFQAEEALQRLEQLARKPRLW